MKTPFCGLLLAVPVWLVACLTPGLARSQTNTNIINAVGYINLELPPGYSLIANPLLGSTNDLNSLLIGAPDGAVFYEFDNATSQYSATTNSGGVWGPLDDDLVPGGGGLLFLPGTPVPESDFLLTFVGEVPQGDLVSHIPAGFSIQSVPIPVAAPFTNSLIHLPLEQGETIYRWDNDTGQFPILFQPRSPGSSTAAFLAAAFRSPSLLAQAGRFSRKWWLGTRRSRPIIGPRFRLRGPPTDNRAFSARFSPARRYLYPRPQ